MLAILMPILLSTSVQQGDRWVIERTLRYVQESDRVDVKKVERLSYSVIDVAAEMTRVQCEESDASTPDVKPVKKIISFKPGGYLASQEEEPNDDVERVNRMEWTATEDRHGISWNRTWPARGTLVEAKVSVRPTSRTPQDTTMAVTYKEGEVTRCVATLKVFNNVRIVEDLGLTINNVLVPGASKLGSLIVTDKLKEIHLTPRP